ncbi:beta-propeller fold lactonase family protein [Acinetobacter sp. ANC 3813]|uniref:beta-propeller fold lactonase family protein n=1 Tax=Acinetobacter sp. ANC 3813 TaxID=1977873 RepID=UPI00111C2DAA
MQAYDYLPKARYALKRNKTLDLHFPAGSGPRHPRFSKNGDYAYASKEWALRL